MSRIYILVLALITASLSNAQLTTVTIEPYQFHEAELGTTDIIPAGAVTYRIYANFTNESDYLSAVYGDASCALQITSTESIFQSSLGSHLGSEVNPAFFASNPELEFDSFATIGMATSEDPGTTIYALEDAAQPWIAPFEAGGDLIIDGAVGGLWFVFNSPEAVNALAGSDLKVLIAQITTTGELSGQASFQVFENGDNTNVIEVSCVPLTNDAVAGCIDEDACNYDPLANLDDGSCEYADEFYDCDGNCLNDSDEDGVCDELEVLGCTDPEACNYDESATEDDGSCGYLFNVETSFTNPSCPGATDGSITLTASAGQEPYEYGWLDGQTGAELTGLGAGFYAYSVTDAAGCEVAGSVDLIDPEAITFSITTIDPSCTEVADGSIIVNVLTGEGVTLEWISPTGITETGNLTGISVGDYILVGTDSNGCQQVEEIELTSDDSGCLFIPTGFTPNNDGYNDDWTIQGSENYPQMNVEVFNRWGQSIFSSSNGYEEAWDGTFEGNRVAMASYYYVITLEPGDEPMTGYLSIKY